MDIQYIITVPTNETLGSVMNRLIEGADVYWTLIEQNGPGGLPLVEVSGEIVEVFLFESTYYADDTQRNRASFVI